MRALKEAQVVEPSDVTVPADQYQYLVEKGLRRLDELERRAIFLRFWQPYTIAQVADQMNMSWDDADRLIDQAVAKIRAVIVEFKCEQICAENSR
jgi:DNA-directed RNA polymerase specialized sigma24 family protein